MQSNPTHPLGQNQNPSTEKKLRVQRKPHRTPYPQEESLQHLAADHITGVNASMGPIQSRPVVTPDQHLDAPPWAASRESHIKLPVAKNRLGQVHPHCLQCLPLGLVVMANAGRNGNCRRRSVKGILSVSEGVMLRWGMKTHLPLSGPVAISTSIMCCISLTTISRVPFARPPGIFRSKITR
jgi:hypothetical protein